MVRKVMWLVVVAMVVWSGNLLAADNGVVPADVASVPTLAEWGLIILSLLLAGCACRALYRKKEMTV